MLNHHSNEISFATFTKRSCNLTLETDSCPWIDFAPSETVGHVLLDIRMIRKRDRPLGFVFHGLPAGTVKDLAQIAHRLSAKKKKKLFGLTDCVCFVFVCFSSRLI